MKAVLILGCYGRKSNDFVLCGAIENIILDITQNTERNRAILDHLDNVYDLCRHPIYTNVHTAIWNIQEKFSIINNPVFPKDLFKNIEVFCTNHVKCGLYLKLELI